MRRALAGIGRELAGLFVDDARYAAAILAWVVLASVLLPRLGLSGLWGGALLFAGLAVILVASARSYSNTTE